MARSRDIQHYPEDYQKIIQDVGVEGKTIKLPFDKASEANSMRGHFYSFIGALKEFHDKWEAKAKTERLTEGTLDLIDKYKQSRLVQLTVEKLDGKPHLVFQNREKSWQAQAIRRAITIDPNEAESARQNPVERASLPNAEKELTVEEQLALLAKVDHRTGKIKE